MKIRHLLLACACTLLPVAAQAAIPAQVDRLIVKWRNADPQTVATDERVQGVAGRLGQRLQRGRNIGGGMSVLRLDRAQQGSVLAATLRALRADPDIELAEPDQLMRIQAYTPNDSLFSGSSGTFTYQGRSYDRQWYLKSAQISAIRADSAWDITHGGSSPAASTVVVAVVDTGVRLDHPDLAGKLLPGFDFVSDTAMANDGNGWDSDPTDPGDFVTEAELPNLASACEKKNSSSWHGTRVSGLIAANTDNGEGMAGTGFNIRVLPVRVLGKCGGYASDVIAGMYWAAGMAIPPTLLQSTNITVNANPAKIINLSLGSSGSCSSMYATAVQDLTDHGVLIVVSAGNEGAAVGNPASCPGALAVAGLRQAGTKVGYSNLGPEVGIAAPAGNCASEEGEPCLYALATTTNAGIQSPGSHTYSDSVLRPTYGTSFSSPLASGTAGLMKAVNPALTPAMIIARIKESARAFPTSSIDTSPQPPSCVQPTVTAIQNAECICTTAVCGAGMLDAHGAVLAAQRPAVVAQVNGVVGFNRQLTLNGSGSAAAAGRSIASYMWSVVSVSGGATSPNISPANQSVATVTSPSAGSYTVRLTVTDNFGSSDAATLTVTAAGDTPPVTTPPSSGGDGGSSGGGGSISIPTLLLAALMLLARRFVIHGSVAGADSRTG